VTNQQFAADVKGLLESLRNRASAESASTEPPSQEGLRERKKRLMRQMISDTATSMFLERGFDEVRVAEVAEACEVSEKTVYNYFPTKESLILDREESMTEGIRRVLGPGGAPGSPVDAAVDLIVDDMHQLYDHWGEDPSHPVDISMMRRFVELFEQTPTLRAAQRDMMDRLVEVAAQGMAARAGVDPEDPEPQIAADALLGLWRVQFRAMRKYADGSHSPAELRDLVIAEVRRAARLIDTGLWSFGMAVQGSNSREQLKVAAESANDARKQVMAAIKQARDAWRAVAAEAKSHEEQWGHGGPNRMGVGRGAGPGAARGTRRRQSGPR
jgi:AcrR family transcriptional regulator